jgi:hypothetical protein
MTQRMLARKPATASAEPQLASSSLRINKPGDTFEQEADRIAETVVSGGRVPSWSIAKVGMGGGTGTVQRDTPDGSNQQQQTPKPNNYDDAAKKAAEAFMQTDAGKKLLQAVESDPLVKSAKDLATTLPGMVITGAAATGAVAALAAEHKPLPIQVPAIPLDFISPKLKGIKLNLTWEGPVDKPTKATIGFSGTFGGGGSDKKKKDDTSERIARDKQALQAGMDMFKPKDKGASDDVGQLLKEGKGAATPGFGIEDFGSSHRSPSPLPGTQGTPLAPLQQPSPQQPATGLQPPGLGAPWRPKTLQLLDKQLELKPLDKVPEASAGKDQQETKKEETPVQRKADPGAPLMQRKCSYGGGGEECDECKSEAALQRKRASSDEFQFAAPIVDEVLRSPGSPLDHATRAHFEPRFGYDFSKVRVHTNTQAAGSARSVNALAYTVGTNLVFASGAYSPGNITGKRLLAHELTHVVQQGGAPNFRDSEASYNPQQEARPGRLAQTPLSGKPVPSIAQRSGPMVQRQEPMPLPEGEVGPLPPEMGVPELEEIPDMEVEDLPELEDTPEMDGATDTAPESTPEPAPSPESSPEPGPQPDTAKQAGPRPMPPVLPRPGEQPDQDKEKDKDPCGSKRLPATHVTSSPGPQGQGGTVLASPLTRCPGNTSGSMADSRVYPKQFDCIRSKKLTRFWIPAHLLHGQTRRKPFRNLHGPGNQAWNVIIAHTGLNRNMNAQVEEPALTRVFDLNQVLWYEARVAEYFPGDEFFAKSIQVTYGLFDLSSGSRGPVLDAKQFTSPENPPACPNSLGAAATPAPVHLSPPPAADFSASMSICHRVLQSRHILHVKNGGLKATFRGQWEPDADTGPALQCANSKYTVSLMRKGLIFDDTVSNSEIPAAKAVSLTWRGLEEGDYFLVISVPDHNPACCLKGDVSAVRFDAPKPARRRKVRKEEMEA